MRAIRKQHPDKDIRIVFQKDNYIQNSGRKTRYSEWAEKNGYIYAIGSIPEEWYIE